jgi:hypothetical protein
MSFCAITGYHRKYGIRLLNRAALPEAAPRPRRRPPLYGPPVSEALTAMWTAAGYPWSVRLKALLPLWLPHVRRRLRLTRAVELLTISPRQIARRLAPQKRQLTKRLYGRTKPGTLLKHHIPLKTDRWAVTTPGFSEIDLVSHSGTSADGEHIHSLNLTDIHTTWVETAAVLGKGAAGAGVPGRRRRKGRHADCTPRPPGSVHPRAKHRQEARASLRVGQSSAEPDARPARRRCDAAGAPSATSNALDASAQAPPPAHLRQGCR